MFTLFHALVFVGLGIGAIFGARAGLAMFGAVGGVVGGVAGAIAGCTLGRIPHLLALRSVARDLRSKSVAELRVDIQSLGCLAPNCALLELHRRGEDICQELPKVLDLLVSEDVVQRGRGWAALTSAFPALAEQVRDYRIGDSVDECRRKTEKLKQAT